MGKCTGRVGTWRAFSLITVIESIKWLTVRSKEKGAHGLNSKLSSPPTPDVRWMMGMEWPTYVSAIIKGDSPWVHKTVRCCVLLTIEYSRTTWKTDRHGMNGSLTIIRSEPPQKLVTCIVFYCSLLGLNRGIFGIRHNQIKSTKLLHVNDISNWHCKFVPRTLEFNLLIIFLWPWALGDIALRKLWCLRGKLPAGRL